MGRKKSRLVTGFTALMTLCIFVSQLHAFTVKDALGRSVTLEAAPERIVSLAPSLTEILYFLGLGERVVGVTRYSYFPPEAAGKPKVGTYINLNVERIISLRPDLAIGTADGNEAFAVKLLSEAGIPVFVVNPRNVRGVIRSIADLGNVCGVGERSAALASGLDSRVDNVYDNTRNLKKPLVFLQINLRPMMTVNRHTFHHDVIRLAGGENMTGDEAITYPRISMEEIIRRGPEVVVISSMERGGEFERARREWSRWTAIPAVKSGRVHLIDSDLIDRPSPRIVLGIERMARIIHPEVNWDGIGK